MISLIAAIGKNHELGKGGDLVFHPKDDMRFFRETTTGHPVIMGRKTWESLPAKLKNRENIVISHGEVTGADRVIHDPEELIREYRDSDREAFVIGGASIYEYFLPYASNLYLTEIDAPAAADVFFPSFDRGLFFREIIKKGKENDLAFTISRYSRK